MKVPALGDPGTGARRLGDVVAVNQDDLVEAIRENPGREQPGHAAAHHDCAPCGHSERHFEPPSGHANRPIRVRKSPVTDDVFYGVESGCMDDISHGSIRTNGVAMHLAEQGEGPAVVLCHGFPELWYSWRHQLKALAEAGYHVVAPDQRGYGQTDRPEAVEEYNLLQLTGDIIGLVDALGETEAVVAGHDW